MKAWVYRKSGKPGDILKLENDWPKPEPKSKQIQVKVHTVSLNPVGWKTMYVFPLSAGQKKPCCPEYDVAGEVSGGDLSGTDLQIGDHVIAFLPHDTVMKSGQGALYEYVVAEQHMVVKKPSNLSMAEACTFPLAGLTVYQNVMKLGGLKKGSGQRVFINGGSGGVGAYAVQLAKAYQAFVVTTSSPASQDLVSSFKPDATIDYRNVNLPEVLQRDYNVKDGKGFDIIFDSVGSGPLYDNAKYYLKSDGVFADVAGPHMTGSIWSALSGGLTLIARMRPAFLGGNPVKYNFALLEGLSLGKELQEGIRFLAEGQIRPIVDQEFSFADVPKAYERQQSGRSKGKVVVKVVD